jgi:predicted MFS family arabinose efflux permease
MRNAVIPIAATLAVQSLMSLATVTLPVLAPEAAQGMGVPISWVGLYVAMVYGAGMAASLASGTMVHRFGALRLSQFGLLAGAAGVALTATGRLPWMICGALLLGVGNGPITPASSHLLQRTAPPGRMSVVFSIKQTGVPLGAMLAGALLPSLVLLLDGWRAAACAVGLVLALLALALQPLRARLDDDRRPDAPLRAITISEPLRLLLSDSTGRALAITCVCFVVLQICLGTYLVAYMTLAHGFDLVQAGMMLAVAQGAGVAGRLVAGALADLTGRTTRILGVMGCVMAASTVAASFSGQWPVAALLLLYAVFGASAISWNGICLAEVARRAPPGGVAAATSGCVMVTYAGIMAGPALFAMLLQGGMTYSHAFMLTALPSLVCGLWLLNVRPQTRA